MEDHGLLYAVHSSGKAVEFLDAEPHRHWADLPHTADRDLLAYFAARGSDPVSVDLPTTDVSTLEATTVRVVAPLLLSPHWGARSPELINARLGLRGEHGNPAPHPLA